ncbi:hypothetical protein VUR80DRAFT_971 [Thermomyces stellatus]
MAPARKTGSARNGLIVTLTVSPTRLDGLLKVSPVKEDTPASAETDAKEKASTPVDANESPQASGQPATQANGDVMSDSNPGTPAPNGTPGPMGPPGKKGVKRGAANGEPKSRGKPGPKKRARVDDGTGEPGPGRGTASHKLGPKANQGAINAGLRALDRSGKPCRRWGKGTFRLKTFTGAVWEIPRWKAPERTSTEEAGPGSESADVSASGSAKGNKDETQAKDDVKSDLKSGDATPNGVTNDDGGANGRDVEMQSVSSVPASSPAPAPVAAAS